MWALTPLLAFHASFQQKSFEHYPISVRSADIGANHYPDVPALWQLGQKKDVSGISDVNHWDNRHI